jgi:hypothetical protein
LEYSIFIKNVADRLLGKGWSNIQGHSEKFDFVASLEETITIVTTRRLIAILKGDGLSRAEIQEAVEEVHKLMNEKAVPPLFPATSVLVFVFEKNPGDDWILEKAKKRDFLKSNHVVSWVVDLTERVLKKHKGLPIIKSGESEIRKALGSNMG